MMFVRRFLLVFALALSVARCADQPTAVKAPASPLALRWAGAPQFTARTDARARRSGTIALDRKSTRLNSSHGYISYAVFCLKKKTLKPTICSKHPRAIQ